MRGDHSGGPARGVARFPSQGDGRKPLPHIFTAIISVALSLGVAHYSGLVAGKQGPSGTTTVITKTVSDVGFCAYFGRDSSGHTRFQVTPAKKNSGGPWCPKGDFVSVTPGR